MQAVTQNTTRQPVPSTRYSIFAGVLRALGYNVADDDFELIDRIDYILRPDRRVR